MTANFPSCFTKAASNVPDLADLSVPPARSPRGPIPYSHFEAGAPSLALLQNLFGTQKPIRAAQALDH